MNHVSQNIKLLRHRAHLTQEAAANMAGVKRCTYAAWEEERSIPRPAQLQKLAIFYHITVDMLLYKDLNGSEVKVTADPAQQLYHSYLIAPVHVRKAVEALLGVG